MLVKFNQAVHLKGKTVKGKDYSRGVHEVHEEHLQDPHFHKLLKAGLVEDGEAAKVVAPLSLHERQKQLAEKLSKPKAPKAPQPFVPTSPQGQSAQVPAEGESGDATLSPPPGDQGLTSGSSNSDLPEEEQLFEESKVEAEKAEKSKSKSKHKGK